MVLGFMVVLLFVFWPARTTLPQQRRANATIASIFLVNFGFLLAKILKHALSTPKANASQYLYGKRLGAPDLSAFAWPLVSHSACRLNRFAVGAVPLEHQT